MEDRLAEAGVLGDLVAYDVEAEVPIDRVVFEFAAKQSEGLDEAGDVLLRFD